MPKELSSAARAFITLKQQLMGADAAMFDRPLRVPKGMWKRGGKRKEGTPEVTHFEAAYKQFSRGRARALANEYLTAREAASEWCKRGFYSTLAVMDLLGGRINDLRTDPAKTHRPAEGADDPVLVEASATKPKAAKPSSKWFTPGHTLKFEDGWDGMDKVIEVSEDGKSLVCSSVKQRRGEPIFCEVEPINAAASLWAQHYHGAARQAGAVR